MKKGQNKKEKIFTKQNFLLDEPYPENLANPNKVIVY